MRIRLTQCLILFAIVSAVLVASAQTAASPVSDDPISDLLQETQRPIRGNNYAGLVWWIPVEFWQRAMQQGGITAESAAEQLKPFRDYVMVAVVVGKIGAFGSITFATADQLRANTILRDSTGGSYPALAKVAPEAENLASMLKPVFANSVGKMGEAVEILFFPAKSASGQWLADPRQKGSFAIVVKDLAGKPESAFEWRLPLTALSPAKFCPVGKERVDANWNYCPWHGVPLNEPAPRPAPAVTPPK